MTCNVVALVEKFLFLAGTASLTVGVVFLVRYNLERPSSSIYAKDRKSALKSEAFIYSIVFLVTGGILYIARFIVSGLKMRKRCFKAQRIRQFQKLLDSREIREALQTDQQLRRNIQLLVQSWEGVRVEYDTKDAFHDQESQQQDSEDPWRTPYYSEYQQKHSPDGAHSSHHYTTTESQYPTSRV